MLTRIHTYFIWIWLPNTAIQGMKTVEELISKEINSMPKPHEFTVKSYTAKELIPFDNAQQLLATFMSEAT
ncbi:hypothetical protein [Facilibium subflavum]|uniref:hypothetical protein n=1 Tax=Facilibium subflavum TaxID=2219058 RepID=UPI000E650EC2|nr:hypothetical protein [Facilibium subflavum]